MPTTPPKTDPELERLAREIAFQLWRTDFIDSSLMLDPEDNKELKTIILQALAPLAEVVSSTRQLVDSVDRWESVVEQIIGRRPELHQYVELEAARRALANLDAGREE